MKTPRAALVAVALVWLAACGGPAGPVEIPPEELPFSLARSPRPTLSPAGTATFTVYLARSGRLVPVTRNLLTAPDPVENAVRALLRGPIPAERGEGLSSAIPANTRLLEVVVVDRIADVDLSSEFQEPGPSESILLRVAQVVWTLVEFPEITAVRFLVDGDLVGVLTDRGVPVDRPVTAPDYASVAPASVPSVMDS